MPPLRDRIAVVTGGSRDAPFWEQPLDHWTSMFEHGVRNHVIACQAGAPLLVRQKGGLIVTTTYRDRDARYVKGNMFYDLAKATMSRLAFAVAEELRPHGVTSLAVSPGWMRTELILAAFKTSTSSAAPAARTRSATWRATTASPTSTGASSRRSSSTDTTRYTPRAA